MFSRKSNHLNYFVQHRPEQIPVWKCVLDFQRVLLKVLVVFHMLQWISAPQTPFYILYNGAHLTVDNKSLSLITHPACYNHHKTTTAGKAIK